MANVNTDSLRSVSASITDIIGRLKAAASYTESACDSLANYANNLKGYNGQKVAEDQRQDSIVNPNNQNVVDMHYYYNTWVTDDGGIAESANQLQKYTTEMLTIVDGLSSKAGVIDSIARTIDSYINSVEATIGNGTTSSPFSPDDTLCSLAGLSFGRKGVEKSNLYFNGERLDYESFLKTGLQNTQLTFKLQDDGTYKVYSNGKETEYSTDALTAAFYQKTLMDQTKAKYGNGADSPAGGNKSTTGDHHAKSGFNTETVSFNPTKSSKKINKDGDTLVYTYDNNNKIITIRKIDKNTGKETIIEYNGKKVNVPVNTSNNSNVSEVTTLPDGSVQKVIAKSKSGNSKVVVTTGSHNGQVCLNDSGKSITPSSDAIESIKSMESSISKEEGINLSKASSVELVDQNGNITKYYYDSTNKNQLIRVVGTDKDGICSSDLPIESYTDYFYQISNLKEGNTRRYLNSNGNYFFETGIKNDGTERLG